MEKFGDSYLFTENAFLCGSSRPWDIEATQSGQHLPWGPGQNANGTQVVAALEVGQTPERGPGDAGTVSPKRLLRNQVPQGK